MSTAIEEHIGEDRLDAGTRRAKRQWEEVWSNPIAAKQNWQRLAFVQAIAIIGAVFWIAQLGGQPKQVLYVVERDKAGNVSYAGPVKPVDMDARTWDVVKVQALKKFIDSWRTVTTDRSAQTNDWDRSFVFVGDGSQAKTALSQWFEENNPIKRADRGELVSVRFKTFDVEGARTYGLWWEETTTSLTGLTLSVKTWRARVTYDMHLPTSETARQENALGVLITELAWEQVQ